MTRQEPIADHVTLDPANWAEVAQTAHRMVDFAIAHLASIRERPVWQPMPDDIRAVFDMPLPEGPQPLDDVFNAMRDALFPWSMGNIHPRFWAWYMGAGNMTGALADFLAAIDGSNLGGSDSAASLVDAQVTRWIVQMTGFPASSSAALVSGGSMANLIGLTAARNTMSGINLPRQGLADMPRPLRFYVSDQVHNCHLKAMNLLGLGHASLSRIQTDDAFRLDIGALRAAIRADRSYGARPACVIASAGTTNTGAIDPLPALADLCRDEGMWLHIDGCIGALIALAPRHRHLVAGLEQADSLALDLHKWMQAPFDVGCVVLRDRALHRGIFATAAEYLTVAQRGIAAAEFLHDYTPETTRGFRALKIWMMLKHHGTAAFGAIIDRNMDQARHFAARVKATPHLTLMAPVATSIICFRHDPGNMDEAALRAHNIEIMLRIQESGIAVLTDTTIRNRHALRVAICNHRTRTTDLDLLIAEVVRLGQEVASNSAQA